MSNADYELVGWEAAKDVGLTDEIDLDFGQDGESDWQRVIKVSHRTVDDGLMCSFVLGNGHIKHYKEREQLLVRRPISEFPRVKGDGHRCVWTDLGDSPVLVGAIRQQCSKCGHVRSVVAA